MAQHLRYDDALDARWSLAWQHREHLLRIARRRTVCEFDAQDAVSEALIRAMHADDLDESRIVNWLTTVTVNLCTDLARERARSRRARSHLRAVPEPSAEQRVLDRELRAAIIRRLSRLPERQREAIMLRAAGFGVDDIARELDVGYGAAQSLVKRARAELRKAIVIVVALVGGARLLIRRLARPAPTTAAAGTVLMAFLAVTPLSSPGPTPAPSQTAAQALTVYLAHAPHAFVSPVAMTRHATTRQEQAPHRRTSPRAAARPHTQTLVPAVDAHEHGYGFHFDGVHQTEKPQSFQEIVLDCVQHPVLSTERVGCPA